MFDRRWCRSQHGTLRGAADITGDDKRALCGNKAQADRPGNMTGPAGMDGNTGQHRESMRFVNGQGMTMIEIAAGKFPMGQAAMSPAAPSPAGVEISDDDFTMDFNVRYWEQAF